MKRVFNIAIVLSLILFTSSAYADILIPANLIARKSNDTAKENVYSWTNSDKYTCDSPVIFFFDEEEAEELCALCPNRKLIKKTGKEIGYSYDLSIYGKTYHNREIGGGQENIFYMCVSNSIKECPKDKPLLDNMGRCHACDDEEPIDISWNTYWRNLTEVCSICSNREVISPTIKDEHSNVDNYFCALKECPEEKPIRDYYGNCHTCDELPSIKMRQYRAAMHGCDRPVVDPHGKVGMNSRELNIEKKTICPNRKKFYLGCTDYSILRECPFGMIRAEDGSCYTPKHLGDVWRHFLFFLKS